MTEMDTNALEHSNIRLMLVDDEKLIRSGMKILLESMGGLEVVASASNGREALAVALQTRPDVVLMDIRMPESNGIEGTRLIKEQLPDTKVLILTTFQDAEYIQEALRLGASGYLLKDSDPSAIYEGIKVAHSGHVVVDKHMSDALIAKSRKTFDASHFDLSEKELEIVKLVAEGCTNKEIADKLYLSEGTIKNNVSVILQKLSLRDRTQLAIFAFESGLK